MSNILDADEKFEIIADTKKVVTKRKQKAITTKTRIFESAIELIKAKGYANVSVEEICEKSGVTKGAFYHHFDSKESLVRLMYMDTDTYLLKRLPVIMKKTSAIERITDILLTLAERAEYKGLEIMKQFIRENLDTNGIINMKDPRTRPLVPFHIAIIADGQENGEIRKDLEPEYIFWYINSSYNGFLLNWCIQNGSYNFKETLKKVLPSILSSIRC